MSFHNIIKKLLIQALLVSCFLLGVSFSYASDFIAPNSSGDPIVIDVSNLNLLSSIDVTIGDFKDQPRPYRDANTKSLVIFPPAVPSSEKTIQIRSGSTSVTKTVSFRPSPFGNLKNSLLPDLQKARGGNTVTKISDGRIILIGGSTSLADKPLNSIEVFDPEVGKTSFLKTPNELNNSKLQIPRGHHTATYLGISESPIGMISGPVEQILISGGFSENGFIEDTLEILEIKVGTVQSTSTLLSSKKAKLKKARLFHTANLLPDGRVLIIGGQGNINMITIGALNSIEIFDPITRSIQPGGISLNTPRLLHTSLNLQDGKILIVGGFTNEKQGEFGFGPATDSCEIIDSANLTIKGTGSLEEAVGGHSATLLTNGLVLVIGGSSDFFSTRTKDEFKGVTTSTVQLYNHLNETFSLVKNKQGGNFELVIPRFLHKSVLLPNSDVAVFGGLNIKAGLDSSNLISTPVSLVEVFNPDLLTFSGNILEVQQKTNLESSIGRILPSVILVTPKNKTQGLLSTSNSNDFVNSAVYVTGGFTNGFGRLPTKISELIQIESNTSFEGRQLKLTPEAIIKGSYLSELLIKFDNFSKKPGLKIEPQTVNLSSSNNFKADIMVLSTNQEVVLLKAENKDPNSPIIISPNLFQVGENVTITRKDNSVQGEFEIDIISSDPSRDFLPAILKVNVSDSAKPFLSTVPGFGISLSDQGVTNSDMVQLKVLSQDGLSEFSSIPSSTQVTVTVSDPKIINLGGSGVSSIVGTLATQFTVNAVKPGKTNLNFSINFPLVLGVSIPVEVSGTPTFSNSPIDSSVLSNLSSNGVELSKAVKLNATAVSIEDIRLSTSSALFPYYVPINLQSSIDGTGNIGLFTIRPIFGVDLLTAIPRTLVNGGASAFKSPLPTEPTTIAGIVPSELPDKPIAILASQDGIRSITYDQSVSEPVNDPLVMISSLSGVKDLKLFEFGTVPKIVALKGTMVFLLDAESGDEETSGILSDNGFELELTKVNSQDAAVVSVGSKGVDLVFPITDAEPRKVNFKLLGDTRHLSVVEKLADVFGPYVIAYDEHKTISIVDLINIDAPVRTISTSRDKILKIDYAGRFQVNGMLTDVLVGINQREILLFDLNNLTSIPVKSDLKIKSQIMDLLIIDGIAYLALGKDGILAVSIGSLLSNDNSNAQIASFKKNKLIVIRTNGTQNTITKPLSANKLANSRPFLLSSGEDNNLTVIRVSP